MALEQTLNNILSTNSKVKIIRLFISRTEDFMSSGREIGRLTGITAPAAHASLKDLYNQDILSREIIGRVHLYKLNMKNRIVKEILLPAFLKELSLKDDVIRFLKDEIIKRKLKNKITSIILYGSLQRGDSHKKSDIDVAIIAKSNREKKELDEIFINEISSQFHDYFGIHLDTYIKTENEFKKRFKENLPPISTLRQSYLVVYGKDPLDF